MYAAIDKELKVSVIISTYRRDESLRRALKSLRSQTLREFETIVVDDNGDRLWNKKVKEITDEFVELNLILITNPHNLGSAETRNIGINAACTDYVTFLDDDDEYLPEKLEIQYRSMRRGDYDFSLTDLDLFFENGKLSEHRTREYIEDHDRESLLRYHLMYHLTGTDTLMFRKDYILSINGFGPHNVGDEFYLMQRAIENGGKFGYCKRCDVKAYVHMGEESLSSGEKKIIAENELFCYKKRYYPMLDARIRRYITMRHYAVLAFAELRRGDKPAFAKYAARSFVAAPLSCCKLIAKR